MKIPAASCRDLQWRIDRPSRKALLRFLSAVSVHPRDESPVNRFLQSLWPAELKALFLQFSCNRFPSGKIIRTTTGAEVLAIPRPRLIQVCRKFPKVELGILKLLQICSEIGTDSPCQIVRTRELMANGSRALCLGIQFDEVSPRVRGAFLAFAEGTGNFDRARNRTGQGLVLRHDACDYHPAKPHSAM